MPLEGGRVGREGHPSHRPGSNPSSATAELGDLGRWQFEPEIFPFEKEDHLLIRRHLSNVYHTLGTILGAQDTAQSKSTKSLATFSWYSRETRPHTNKSVLLIECLTVAGATRKVLFGNGARGVC